MKYFVTKFGIDEATNLTQSQAVVKARQILKDNPSLGTCQVGIGRMFFKKGKKCFTLMPCHFYFN
jgi:NifU-like protein involved in Fe-S cluster formation